MRAAVGIIYLAVAQLVEHGIVVGYNFPVVLGSNPGGEISAPTALKKYFEFKVRRKFVWLCGQVG